MYRPIKLVDIEMTAPLVPIDGLSAHDSVRALVRVHGTPVGYAVLQPRGAQCSARATWDAVMEQCGDAVIRHLVPWVPASGCKIPSRAKRAPHAVFPRVWREPIMRDAPRWFTREPGDRHHFTGE